MKKGFVAIHRTLQEHWLWKEKPFSRAQAWIDLVMMANHTANKFVLGNELMEVERGQLITSEKKLMERWGWSKSKTRAFMKLLENDGMIVKKTDHKKTTLTICQYSDYQDWQTTDEPRRDREETAKRPRRDTNNNEGNNEGEFLKNEREQNRLAHNLIFCFKEAYEERYITKYTPTKEDKETAHLLAEKLKAPSQSSGKAPWEWIKGYFKEAMRVPKDGNAPILNDYHRGKLSPAHIYKHFNEINALVFDRVYISANRQDTVDARLKAMGMIPTIDPDATPGGTGPTDKPGDADGIINQLKN